MNKYIDELIEQVNENKLVEGEYVINVYAVKSMVSSMGTYMSLRFVYKNKEDFKNRCVEDCKSINTNEGVYFEWRTFD
jgi:hypothetical protein